MKIILILSLLPALALAGNGQKGFNTFVENTKNGIVGLFDNKKGNNGPSSSGQSGFDSAMKRIFPKTKQQNPTGPSVIDEWVENAKNTISQIIPSQPAPIPTPPCDPVVPPLQALINEALLQMLHGNILGSPSAMAALEKWCAVHNLASPARVSSIKVDTTALQTPSDAKIQLWLLDTDTVVYRRVNLTCGDKVLSVSDNWYVANRLSPNINIRLNTTTNSFIIEVSEYNPIRRTVGTRFPWRPLPVGWEKRCGPISENETSIIPPNTVLEHHAVVQKQNGETIAYVRDRFTNTLFEFLNN